MITGKMNLVKEEVGYVRELWNLLSTQPEIKTGEKHKEVITVSSDTLKIVLMAIMGIYKYDKQEGVDLDEALDFRNLVRYDPIKKKQ